jgi:hypothetical protein
VPLSRPLAVVGLLPQLCYQAGLTRLVPEGPHCQVLYVQVLQSRAHLQGCQLLHGIRAASCLQRPLILAATRTRTHHRGNSAANVQSNQALEGCCRLPQVRRGGAGGHLLHTCQQLHSSRSSHGMDARTQARAGRRGATHLGQQSTRARLAVDQLQLQL